MDPTDRRLPGEGLPHELFFLTYQIERRIRPFFRKAKLHWGLRRILQRLWVEDGLSQKELSVRIGSSEASVSNLLKHLLDKDLVERRQDQYDYRISRVYLTPNGKALGNEIREALIKLDHRIHDILGESDTAKLRALLDTVQQDLAAYEPDEKSCLVADSPSPPGEL